MMLDGNKIISVKLLGDSAYLVNGNITVPKENVLSSCIDKWLSEGNTLEPEFTDKELKQQEVQNKIAEAQDLLDSTEFKFNLDYDLKYTSEWEELKEKRAIARQFIRDNK